jgi:hypothetical protein
MSGNQQEEADRQAAIVLQQMQSQTMSMMGRLTITVVQVIFKKFFIKSLLINLVNTKSFKSFIYSNKLKLLPYIYIYYNTNRQSI